MLSSDVVSDVVERHASTLAALILEANSCVADRALRRGVDRVLRRALRQTTFFKTFAGAVVKYGSTHPRGKSESYYLAKWIVCIMRRLSLPESQKPISRLLHVAGRCLDRLQERDFGRAARRWRRLAATDAAFRNEMWSIAVETGSTSLLRLVCDAIASSERDPLRPALLTHYCTNILASKTPPTPTAICACRSLIGSLTRTEFAETVLPALTRALRRNPEVVLDIACALFRDLHLDVSLFGLELQKSLLSLIRHTSATVQADACDVHSAIAKLMSDRDVLQQMVCTLEDIMSGKSEGKVKNIHERLSLIKSIGGLSASPSKKPEFSCHITTSLAALYEQEGTRWDPVGVRESGYL